jgi:glycine cleavage system H protein
VVVETRCRDFGDQSWDDLLTATTERTSVMRFKFDDECRYTETHEWIRLEGDIAVAGITDYAQDQLSDVVYVEVPEIGDSFAKGDSYAVVESVKAAADCYLAIGGEVIEVNEALETSPQLVNEDTFGAGWFVKFSPEDASEAANLMDAAAYQEFVAREMQGEGGH